MSVNEGNRLAQIAKLADEAEERAHAVKKVEMLERFLSGHPLKHEHRGLVIGIGLTPVLARSHQQDMPLFRLCGVSEECAEIIETALRAEIRQTLKTIGLEDNKDDGNSH